MIVVVKQTLVEKLHITTSLYQKLYRMYTIQDTVYADAGKYLKCGNKVAFQMKASENIEELDLNLDDIQIVNNYAYYNNGLFAQEVNPR